MTKNPIKNAWGLHALNKCTLFLKAFRLPCQIFSTQKIFYYMISEKGRQLNGTKILFLFQHEI